MRRSIFGLLFVIIVCYASTFFLFTAAEQGVCSGLPSVTIRNTYPEVLTRSSCSIVPCHGRVSTGGVFEISDDLTPPRIDPAPNMTVFVELSQNARLTWVVYDENPSHFRVYLNDVMLVGAGPLGNGEISVRLLRLTEGTYWYKLVVWDIDGNSSSSLVAVTYVSLVHTVSLLMIVVSLALIALLSAVSLRRMWAARPLESIVNSRTRDQQAVSVEEICSAAGMPKDTVLRYLKRYSSFVISSDGTRVTTSEALSRRLQSLLEERGIVRIEDVFSGWDVSRGLISKMIWSLPFEAVTSRGNIVTGTWIAKSVSSVLNEKGILDLNTFSAEHGVDVRWPGIMRYVNLDDVVFIPQLQVLVSREWFSGFLRTVRERKSVDVKSLADSLSVDVSVVIALLQRYVPGRLDKLTGIYYALPSAYQEFPASRMPEGPLPTTGTQLKVLRGGEFVGNRFRYKVKLVNESKLVVTDVTVSIISYPRESLKLEGETTKVIPKLEPGGFRSPSFDFLPTQDCVKGDIVASVSYLDSAGNPRSQTTERFTVRAVCDLLVPQVIGPEDFEARLKDMNHGEMVVKVNDWTPEEMHSKTIQVLNSANFFGVESTTRDMGQHVESRITGWARGKYTGKDVGVEVIVTGRPGVRGASCKVRVSGEDEAMVLPAIDEISQRLCMWMCPRCSACLPIELVNELKAGRSVVCSYCGATIDR
ncbi:MAG: hypothetical protein QXS20_05540 [Candidatus Thorarchaeota archaeon]